MGVAVAPHGDEEVHPDQTHVEEHVEQEQVEGEEHAEGRGLEEEEGGEVLPGPPPQVDGIGDADQEQQRGHGRQGQRDAVDAHLVTHSEGGYPLHRLHQLEAAVAAVEAQPGQHHQGERRRGHGKGEQPGGALGQAGGEQQDDGGGEGDEDGGGQQDGYLPRAATATAATRPTATMT